MASLSIWLPLLQLLLYAVTARSQQWPAWPKDFRWSSHNAVAGFHCLKITEPSEPSSHSWADNYFCANGDSRKIGWRWSYKGRIRGMRCTRIHEPADPHTWGDNYLCLPYNAPYVFEWSYKGRISGQSCIAWREDSDPNTWNDNFLCARPWSWNAELDDPLFPDDFRWSYAGIPDGYNCVQIREPSEKKYWADNFFCWRRGIRDPGIQWSYRGRIPGMRCTRIHEPADWDSWGDNYLCVPPSSILDFTWRYKGKPRVDQNCIKWNEPRERRYWQDNYLCQIKCKLTRVQYIGKVDFRGRYAGTQIIGIASGGSCIGSSTQTIKVNRMDTVEESVGIELSQTREINWSLSASILVGGMKFIGGALGLTGTVGGSRSWTRTTKKDFTKGTTSGVGYETTFRSPGAAISFGITDRFDIDEPRVPCRMHFRCPSGRRHVRDSAMRLKATTYQAAHFETLVGRYYKRACAEDRGLPRCVRRIPRKFRNFFGSIGKVRAEFIKCFAGGKGSISK